MPPGHVGTSGQHTYGMSLHFHPINFIMKYTITILLAVCASLCMTAQILVGRSERLAKLPETIPLDFSYIECIYSYKVYDPAYDETREDFKILEVGHKYSKYSDYGEYQLDSVVATDYPDGVITLQEYLILDNRYQTSSEATLKELSSRSIKT